MVRINKKRRNGFLIVLVIILALVVLGLMLFFGRLTGNVTENITGNIIAGECTKILSPGADLSNIAVSPGDIVCLRAGTYSSKLVTKVPGTASQKIIYTAYPGDECLTYPNMTKYRCNVKLKALSINHPYIRVEGFMFDSPIVNPAITIDADNVDFVNNFVYKTIEDATEIGEIGDPAEHILIENNEFYRIGLGDGGDCLEIRGNYVTIRRNYIHLVVDDCLGIKEDYSNGFIIEYNKIGGLDHDLCPGCHPDLFETYELKNFIIRFNTFFDMTQLVYLAPDGGMTVENGYIYGNVFYNQGYYLSENPNGPIGKGDLPGVFLDRSKGGTINNVSIFSNTFGWLGADGKTNPTHADNYKGVQIDGGVTGTKVYNNIFYSSHMGSETDDVESDYNLYYCPGLSKEECDFGMNYPWSALKIDEPHSIYGDPKFVNYETTLQNPNHRVFDFRLLSGSAAINAANFAGSGITLPSPYLDKEGKTRTAPYDAGAFEYGAVSACVPANCPQPTETQCQEAYCVNPTTCGIRNKNEGLSCNDNSLCTVLDKCTAGVCGGNEKDCSSYNFDGFACTDTECNPANGNCEIEVPNDSKCLPGSICLPPGDVGKGGCKSTASLCKDVGAVWTNNAMSKKIGKFSVLFEATPNQTKMDGVIAFSNGALSLNDYVGTAVAVRFADSGIIDVRNNNSYQALTAVTYQPNIKYYFNVSVDVRQSRYSVLVKPQNGNEVVIAKDYLFRNGQQGVAMLDNYILVADPGKLDFCSFQDEITVKGDINTDGYVDVVDLLYLVDAFGSIDGDPNYNPASDFNHDGTVTVTDLMILFDNFAKSV